MFHSICYEIIHFHRRYWVSEQSTHTHKTNMIHLLEWMNKIGKQIKWKICTTSLFNVYTDWLINVQICANIYNTKKKMLEEKLYHLNHSYTKTIFYLTVIRVYFPVFVYFSKHFIFTLCYTYMFEKPCFSTLQQRFRVRYK